jgi:PAS domain S-box-containing protein
VNGWSGFFETAFRQSRNAMVLLDERRILVDVNGACLKLLGYPRGRVIGEPISRFVAERSRLSAEEWASALTVSESTGEAELICADGSRAGVQWGATVEVVTGRRLVLVVALSTSRWGGQFRRTTLSERDAGSLSKREQEIVRLIALGSTGPEIADELQIAHDTVRTHVRNSMTKLQARSRAHLVANALGDGAVPA